jgi:predicted nucleotidyltransferase
MRNYFEHGRSELPGAQIEEILERRDYDDELTGAEMLGRDMAGLGSDPLRGAVLAILERETDVEGTLELARELEPYEPDRAFPRLAALENGFLAGGSTTRG